MGRLSRHLVRLSAAVLAALALAVAVLVALGWTAFGQAAAGERRARMERSRQWAGGRFENPQPLWNDAAGSLRALLEPAAVVAPVSPAQLPVVRGDEARFQTPPASGLRITWFGHSSTLIELDGVRVLTDPIWSERASPYTFVGPRRWYPPLVDLGKLPVDAVVVSHDHYDHLDEATVRSLKDKRFFVALGVGAHLEYWGVPRQNITELDWWEEGRLGPVRVVATPARHASGRQVLDQGGTLWTSWSLVGPAHRVFYSGDTGLHLGLHEIGERLGPFDVAMVEIGQYHRAWPDWHIGPEQAVKGAGWVRGRVFFPIHWGLFTLARHAWTEPIERAAVAAAKAGQPMVAPRPGQSVEPTQPWAQGPWWPKLEWQRAEEHPIVSTRVE